MFCPTARARPGGSHEEQHETLSRGMDEGLSQQHGRSLVATTLKLRGVGSLQRKPISDDVLSLGKYRLLTCITTSNPARRVHLQERPTPALCGFWRRHEPSVDFRSTPKSTHPVYRHRPRGDSHNTPNPRTVCSVSIEPPSWLCSDSRRCTCRVLIGEVPQVHAPSLDTYRALTFITTPNPRTESLL